jgi:phosphoglycolate phosphatase
MTSRYDRAVLFDLDGTLLDTAPDLAGALNDLRAARGLAALPLAELAPMCSFGGRGMLAQGFGLAPGDATYRETYDAFVAAYRQRMTRETHPFPGIRELLTALPTDGWGWGVVTNKIEALARPLLEFIAFEPAPACVIGGDSAARPKPDPAPLLLACEQLNVAPARCIYIGDSDRDIAAGRAAGMYTIGVAYGYIPPGDDIHAWHADVVVASTAELRGAAADLRARIG